MTCSTAVMRSLFQTRKASDDRLAKQQSDLVRADQIDPKQALIGIPSPRFHCALHGTEPAYRVRRVPFCSVNLPSIDGSKLRRAPHENRPISTILGQYVVFAVQYCSPYKQRCHQRLVFTGGANGARDRLTTSNASSVVCSAQFALTRGCKIGPSF